MNKLFLLLLVVVFIVGCGSFQDSSMEEAKFVVQKRSDFQEIIQYFSVRSTGIHVLLGWADMPSIRESDPGLVLEDKFVHVIIYKAKNNNLKLLFLSDDRPPKVLFEKELK